MTVLFAAYKQKSVGDIFTPFLLGMTETLAPVSIKNDRREFLSVINRRYDVVVAPVPAASNAAFSFPDGRFLGNYMGACIAAPLSRTYDGSNTLHVIVPCGVECYYAVGGGDDVGLTIAICSETASAISGCSDGLIGLP